MQLPDIIYLMEQLVRFRLFYIQALHEPAILLQSQQPNFRFVLRGH